MSYTVFARKYRPQRFKEVLGQEHITTTLSNAIEQQRIAHAYIFVGPRGTGKTSTARIFAMALNCPGGPKADFDVNDPVCLEIAQGRSLDVIEIDGASNNGVEQVRDLREKVRFAPAQGRYKIYIIDEVHMLSTQAFNALLKTLEEPPAHAIFLMATTDVQKVLPTILSRCQRFDLRRIPTATIAGHLLWIAEQENFTLEPAAADAVARGAEGGLRDAESMLDQLVAFCGEKITEEDVLNVFGFTAKHAISELCAAVLGGDCPGALRSVNMHAGAGKDIGRLMADLISHLRNLLVLKADSGALDGEWMEAEIHALQIQAEGAQNEKLLDLIEQFAAAESRMKWAANKKMHFEVAVIRAVQTLQSATLTEVLDTLTALRGGQPPPHSPSPASPPKAAPSAPQKNDTAILKQKTGEQKKSAPPVISPEIEPPPTAIVQEAPPPMQVEESGLWSALVQFVREDRKIISAWLETGVLLDAAGDVVLIGFAPEQSFAKDFLEKNHLQFLEDTSSALLGRTVRIRLEIREGIKAAAQPASDRDAAVDPMVKFKNDPLIRRAMELFRAKIQPI